MTASTTTGRTPVSLRDPAQLLAALPCVLGFRPGNSVVLIGHRPPGTRVGLVLRADLPPKSLRRRQAEALAPRMAASPHTGVTVLVIGGRRRSDGPPPHSAFVDRLREALGDQGLPVLHALWTPEIAAGRPWQCYQDEHCGGTLPDPRATVAAAETARSGEVVFDSRDELEEMLTPSDPEAIGRRAERLAVLLEPPWPDADRVASAGAEIRTALERLSRGLGLPGTDDEIIRLACALEVKEIRDACLALAVPPGTAQARQADVLWLTLVRELPAPERAEPAALLAYSAFMHGGGAFAGMALENALDADPDHLLARLLAEAIAGGVSPERLRCLADVPTLDELAPPGFSPGGSG